MFTLLRPTMHVLPSLRVYTTLLVLCLLSRVVFAAPNPAPVPVVYKHLPQVGEIVHYDPHRGLGESPAKKAASLFKPHEATHITIGHDAHGHAVLAPVTNQWHHQGFFRPRVSAQGMGALKGDVLLDHTVVADPKRLHYAAGKNRGHVVSGEQLEKIRGGHALVHALHTAAAAHDKAHHAHLTAANLHEEAAHRYSLAGPQYHKAAQALQNLGKTHHAAAENHQRLAGLHTSSARFVKGASPEELRHTMHSVQVAEEAERAGHEGAAFASGAIAKLGKRAW